MNNFQQLQIRRTAGFAEASPRIKKKIDKTYELFQFIGNIVDLYIPKAIDTMNNMMDGHESDDDINEKPINQ